MRGGIALEPRHEALRLGDAFHLDRHRIHRLLDALELLLRAAVQRADLAALVDATAEGPRDRPPHHDERDHREEAERHRDRLLRDQIVHRAWANVDGARLTRRRPSHGDAGGSDEHALLVLRRIARRVASGIDALADLFAKLRRIRGSRCRRRRGRRLPGLCLCLGEDDCDADHGRSLYRVGGRHDVARANVGPTVTEREKLRPRPWRCYAAFTSPTSLVKEVLASPNSMLVAGALNSA